VKNLWKKLQDWDEKRWVSTGMKKWEVSRRQGKKQFIRAWIKGYVVFSFFWKLAYIVIVRYGILITSKPLGQVIIKLILGIIFDIAVGYWIGKMLWEKTEECYLKVTSEREQIFQVSK
jgi:hypothetical protein